MTVRRLIFTLVAMIATTMGMSSRSAAQTAGSPAAVAGGGTTEGVVHVAWVAGWSTLHPGGLSALAAGMEPGLLHALEFEEPCEGDLNGDGIITTSDLLILLSDFGTLTGGPADFNGDGVVGTGDLLIFLGLFGADCSP